jgi:hypothetical protein
MDVLAPTSARWLPRLAVLMVLLFVVATWLGVLLADVGGGGAGSSIKAPFALLITGIALVLAVGLWLRRSWAYWAAIVAGSWQLLSHLLFIVVGLAAGRRLGLMDWVFALLLAVFMAVLLIPATRRGCMPAPPVNGSAAN